MAFTQAQLDSLESALAEGALTVKYEDRLVTYRSLEEMLATRNLIRKAIGVAPAGPNRILASPSKFGQTASQGEIC